MYSPSSSRGYSSSSGTSSSGSRYATMPDRIQTSFPQQRGPDVPRAVATLLETTKQLQEMLNLWSVRRVNEQQVSDVYVRVGTTFNETVTAFASIAIDLSDLYTIPQELRTVLESCLGQEPSPQALASHMPQVRRIIYNLLQGLRNKQPQYWRAVGGNQVLVP